MKRRWRGLAWFCAGALALHPAAPAGAQPSQDSAQQAQKSGRRGAAAGSAAARKAAADAYAQRFAQVCAACHGANGRSEMAGTPVLAGQHSFYAITQLFLFREGRRDNEPMTAVAKTMSDADMQGFADHIGALPPVPPRPPATPPDAARMRRGAELAHEHKCVFCHGPQLDGGQQVPRIAGQHEDYLRTSLLGFRSGSRPGYTQAMTGLVTRIAVEDVNTLAYYIARFPAAKAAPSTK